MLKSETLLLLEEREKALWDFLKSFPKSVTKILPVSPDEVKEILMEYDENVLTLFYRNELLVTVNELNDQYNNFDLLSYTWFPTDGASGCAIEKCIVRGFSRTELRLQKDIFLERRHPYEKGRKINDIGFLSTDFIMSQWYKKLCKRYDKATYETKRIRNTELYIPFRNSKHVYHELFSIKLLSILEKAYKSIDMKKPQYLYVGAYKHSPVLLCEN